MLELATLQLELGQLLRCHLPCHRSVCRLARSIHMITDRCRAGDVEDVLHPTEQVQQDDVKLSRVVRPLHLEGRRQPLRVLPQKDGCCSAVERERRLRALLLHALGQLAEEAAAERRDGRGEGLEVRLRLLELARQPSQQPQVPSEARLDAVEQQVQHVHQSKFHESVRPQLSWQRQAFFSKSLLNQLLSNQPTKRSRSWVQSPTVA